VAEQGHRHDDGFCADDGAGGRGASSALGATGGNFILGRSNVATTVSTLSAKISAPALNLINTSTGAAATALNISVASGKPPLKVNAAAGKATNLNSDKLDGVDSTGFLRSTAKAKDADKLDGLDSTQVVQGGGKIHRFGPADLTAHSGKTLLDIGALRFEGACYILDGQSRTQIWLYNDVSGPVSFAVQSPAGNQSGTPSSSSAKPIVDQGGTALSTPVSGYAHHLSSGKQIFFELYQYRVRDFLGQEHCTFGGYVLEG
jgi:hypothetical protein